MDFPKMGHFSRVLDGFWRWFMVIMVFLWSGRNGFIQMISQVISYLLLCMLTGELLTNERPGMLDPDQSEAGRGSSRWSRSSITLRSSPCESEEWAKALTGIRVSKKSIKLSYFLLNKYLLSDQYLCSVCWWDWEIELEESLERAKPERLRAIDKLELEEGR